MKIAERKDGALHFRFWGVAGASGIFGVIFATISVIAFLLLDLPGYKLNRELAERTLRMELLDHALRDSIDAERRESLRLLLVLDALSCEDPQACATLEALAQDPSWTPPYWAEIDDRFESVVLQHGRYERPYEPQVPSGE